MAEEKIREKYLCRENDVLVAKACNYFVGGVNSPVRSFQYAGGKPLVIQKAAGPFVWDYCRNKYKDYMLAFGALILGHRPFEVLKRVEGTLQKGFHYGTTTLEEIELAEIIQRAIPFIEKIRFVNSGTEAVMGAVRLARGVTGRKKIVKFKHAYHGHADYLLVDGGSGLATLQIPLSKGVPQEFFDQTVVCDFGDSNGIKRIFHQWGADIAAVIVEPVGGNYGVVAPDIKFLKYLRKITEQYSSHLIFDEVITGFRFSFGAAADLYDVKPDLICLGKIIGGGFPVGAYGGSGAIMNHLAPTGEVYQASTFAGNPVVMAAGRATLEILESQNGEFARLDRYGNGIAETLREAARDNNVDLSVNQYRSMFSVKFQDKAVFQRFYQNMIHRGVLLAPSEYEANFISFAHSEEVVQETKEAIREAMASL